MSTVGLILARPKKPPYNEALRMSRSWPYTFVLTGLLLLATCTQPQATPTPASVPALSPTLTPTLTPTATPSATSVLDSDGDGWPDAQEQRVGTNSYRVDTDGDGYWDPQDPNPLDSDIPLSQATPTPTATPTLTPTPTPTAIPNPTVAPIVASTPIPVPSPTPTPKPFRLPTPMPLVTISGSVRDLFTNKVLVSSAVISIGGYIAQVDTSGGYEIELPVGTYRLSALDTVDQYFAYVDETFPVVGDQSKNLRLIPKTFDMEHFNAIARVTGGRIGIVPATSRWTSAPRFYIDTNTIWNFDRTPTKEEIDLVVDVIRNDLPALTNGLISDPEIQVGTDPPVPYTTSNRQSDHVAEGWVIVRFDATMIPS